MRYGVCIGVLVMACAAPAAAQSALPTPLSGPNTAIPSPVCDVINFGFCPQPPPPAPPFPDPNEAQRVEVPPPQHAVPVRHLRRHAHRHAYPG